MPQGSDLNSQESKPWNATWFDTQFYKLLYAHRDGQEALQLVEWLQRDLQITPPAHVLDLGCGRGRHSIALAKHGFTVTGLDLSEQSLKDAREKADSISDFEQAVYDHKYVYGGVGIGAGVACAAGCGYA